MVIIYAELLWHDHTSKQQNTPDYQRYGLWTLSAEKWDRFSDDLQAVLTWKFKEFNMQSFKDGYAGDSFLAFKFDASKREFQNLEELE